MSPGGVADDALLVQLDEEALEILKEDGKLVIPRRDGPGRVVLAMAEFSKSDGGEDVDVDRGVR